VIETCRTTSGVLALLFAMRYNGVYRNESGMSDASNQVDVTISLPIGLVREAEASGLLTAANVEAMLRVELRSDRVRRLFDAANRLAALPGSPLTASEIEKEIQTARDERHKTGATRP
jgi:hypothetical protein